MVRSQPLNLLQLITPYRHRIAPEFGCLNCWQVTSFFRSARSSGPPSTKYDLYWLFRPSLSIVAILSSSATAFDLRPTTRYRSSQAARSELHQSPRVLVPQQQFSASNGSQWSPPNDLYSPYGPDELLESDEGCERRKLPGILLSGLKAIMSAVQGSLDTIESLVSHSHIHAALTSIPAFPPGRIRYGPLFYIPRGVS